MKFTKLMMAAAMLAGAGAANATLVNNAAVVANNEAWLSVYDATALNSDGTTGRTFNFDLGVNMGQVEANGIAAFSAVYGTGFDLSTNANWVAFRGAGASATGLVYTLLDGESSTLLHTGSTLFPTTDVPAGFSAYVNAVQAHAATIGTGEINAFAAGNSSVINDQPVAQHWGQFNNTDIAANAIGLYNGGTYNPTQAYGSAISLFLDSSVGTKVGRTTTYTYTENVLGQVTLAGNTLTVAATVAAVPLPAAVWMFGAGLMGFLGMTRRKSVQA